MRNNVRPYTKLERRLAWLAGSLSAAMLATGVAAFATAPKAHGLGDLNGWQQPYGGCQEATLAPHSTGAEQCRAHGWTITRRLAVNPRAVLKGTGLPHCRHEDGSGQRSACIWIGHVDGNKVGLSYWVGRNDHVHYVWPSSPVASRWAQAHHWSWVTRPLGDALAEGGSPDADTRDWRQCAVHTGPTTRVWCADSLRAVEVS